MTERWLPVVGFEGFYEVSDLGRVRSLDRIITLHRYDGHTGEEMWVSYKMKGRILKPELRKNTGYLYVMLGRKTRHRAIHRLVLEAFVGPCPEGQEARHLDDLGAHNELSNLLWGTRADNQHDAIRNGRSPIGEAKHGAKLKAADIPSIRARLMVDGCAAIAKDYHVSETAIRNIKVGRSWSHA